MDQLAYKSSFFNENLTLTCHHLSSLQVRYEEITSDPAYLDQILSEGARKAADIAETTVNNVYQAMGFFQR